MHMRTFTNSAPQAAAQLSLAIEFVCGAFAPLRRIECGATQR